MLAEVCPVGKVFLEQAHQTDGGFVGNQGFLSTTLSHAQPGGYRNLDSHYRMWVRTLLRDNFSDSVPPGNDEDQQLGGDT